MEKHKNYNKALERSRISTAQPLLGVCHKEMLSAQSQLLRQRAAQAGHTNEGSNDQGAAGCKLSCGSCRQNGSFPCLPLPFQD